MALFKKTGRPFKYYDIDSFYQTYRMGLVGSKCSDEVMVRLLKATSTNAKTFKVFDDEMDEILQSKKDNEEFERRLFTATDLNNKGIALEKDGDIASAISAYEQNILPNTYFTLNPYKRLCILYRKAGDYANEVRVIETCLSRAEWETKQYSTSRERSYFEDRLQKARTYQAKSNK